MGSLRAQQAQRAQLEACIEAAAKPHLRACARLALRNGRRLVRGKWTCRGEGQHWDRHRTVVLCAASAGLGLQSGALAPYSARVLQVPAL
jgi:hypothetical protein